MHQTNSGDAQRLKQAHTGADSETLGIKAKVTEIPICGEGGTVKTIGLQLSCRRGFQSDRLDGRHKGSRELRCPIRYRGSKKIIVALALFKLAAAGPAMITTTHFLGATGIDKMSRSVLHFEEKLRF